MKTPWPIDFLIFTVFCFYPVNLTGGVKKWDSEVIVDSFIDSDRENLSENFSSWMLNENDFSLIGDEVSEIRKTS